MNSPSNEPEEPSGPALKVLKLDTAKNPETGIVSDYFKDHNAVTLVMGMGQDKTLKGAIQAILGMQPGWRIKTYRQYYSEYQGGDKYYNTAEAQKNISIIDENAAILNEEIQKCENGDAIDEKRFKDAWNRTSRAVYGAKAKQI